MKQTNSRGFSLLELMFGIGIALAAATISVAMWRSAQSRADANASVTDLGRVRTEIGAAFNTTAQSGYVGITSPVLRTRTSNIEDLWVAGQNTYRIGPSLTTIAASDRVPGGAGVAGDSYRITIRAAKPAACQAMLTASVKDAVFARITPQGGGPIVLAGLPGAALDADIQAACNNPPAVQVELDFNT